MDQSRRAGREAADEIVKTWPEAARQAANAMMDQYGAPDEASASLLLWHGNGPWLRTVAYREEAQHNFPTPHRDVLEQFIPYRVPVDKLETIVNLYGKDSNKYRVRVKGEFPTKDDDTVIPLELVEAAKGRKVAQLAYWPIWTGQRPAPQTGSLAAAVWPAAAWISR